MNTHVRCEIEFVGGPLDGHVDKMEFPLEAFLGVKTAPASETHALLAALIRWLRGGRGGFSAPFAVYELDRNGSRLCYRYRGTQLLAPQQLSGGQLRAIVDRPSETMR